MEKNFCDKVNDTYKEGISKYQKAIDYMLKTVDEINDEENDVIIHSRK